MVRRGMAAALCAAALLLSGCSDDPPEPKPLDPPTESESPTTPPTSEPPKAQTPEQFIREWFQASYKMQKSGETVEFRKLGDGCRPCNEVAVQVKGIYAAGGWVKPSVARISTVVLERNVSPTRRIYRVTFNAAPWSIKERASAKPDRKKGGRGTYLMEVEQVDDRWLLKDYDVVVSGRDS